MKRYIIGEEELEELLEDSKKLRALESGGVDNWEWYDLSMEDHYSDEEIDLSDYEEYKENE